MEALFGAPKDRDDDGVVSGSVYGCNILDRVCEKILKGKSKFLSLAGRRVEMKAENMSYGMSMAYDFKNEQFSVCAPRSTLSWVNGPDVRKDLHYFTIGSCYVYTKELLPLAELFAEGDLQRAEDLNDHDKFKVLHHINSMRELGFSVSTKNGKYVLGAPGYQDWSGKSVTYETAMEQYPYSTTPVEMRDSADYSGYAVDQITVNKTEYVVHGSPRRNNVVGEVILATHGATHNTKTNIRIPGVQTGEYFGAAVAVADVNCDGIDDLLVGAPFNSPTEDVRDTFGSVTAKLAKGKYDRGAVYVFMGKENDIDRRHSKVLYPDDRDESSGGRFGSVITNLGDLDKDRCDEIAIGAPFEGGRGAVYIFRGSAKHGLSNDDRIKIEPPRPEVEGFGYSISKGLDITGNKYLDFAVGAVLSGHGFVYRSRPVIIVRTSIKLTEKQIPKDGGKCSANGRRDLFCVNMTICTSYDDPEPTSSDEARSYFLKLDISADVKSKTPRALIALDSYDYQQTAMSAVTRVVQLDSPGKEECIDVRAFVLPASLSRDMLNPIEFRVMYDIEAEQPGQFCANCPVLYSKEPASATTAYMVNCKHEGCVVHLRLRASVDGLENGQAIAIGRTEPLTLKIDVDSASRSDIAFRTEVVVTLNSGFVFNNPDKCSRVENTEDSIACLVDNEFQAGESRSISLKLQLDASLSSSTSTVSFGVALVTASKDQNAQANNVTFEFPLVLRADAGISGAGLLENVIFKKNSSDITMDHVYTVTKYHESPVDSIELTVRVPIAKKSDYLHRYPLVKVFSAETKTSDSSVKIDCIYQNEKRVRRNTVSVPKSASLTLPTSTVRQLKINCESFSCRLYKCSLGPLMADQIRTTFHLQLQLNISELIDQARVIPEVIVFRSDAAIVLKNRQPFTSELNPKPKSAAIETILVREGKPLGRGIDWWWILLAVIVGLIMVSIIFYGLYKCGFFKRNSREDLNELQKEPQSASPILAAHHSPINNMVDVDDNDNTSTFHDSKV
ncbi:integrin alpha pat-2 [Galendromus occidentalis]|uniref:Integrin alpha pat-2 n=1 Tax=Galendromus occidentalis TaxID=34638 RepID=A0AAJ7L547_9ACAR|nr:integrin alpha pat-2 [Galendromus occidentalis]